MFAPSFRRYSRIDETLENSYLDELFIWNTYICVCVCYDDLQNASSGSSIGPVHSFPLSNNPQVQLTDFCFNPVIVEMFAVVTSDGIVTNYELGYQASPELKIHGKNSIGATCCKLYSVVGKKKGKQKYSEYLRNPPIFYSTDIW